LTNIYIATALTSDGQLRW